MIFTSLAKFNVNEIGNDLELSEINVSQTSNLTTGQAIGEEWVLSFTEESVIQVSEYNSTHTLITTFLEDDSNSVRTAKLSITDGMNVTPIFQLTNYPTTPSISVISADANHVIYFEKNSSSLCELKKFNLSSSQSCHSFFI